MKNLRKALLAAGADNVLKTTVYGATHRSPSAPYNWSVGDLPEFAFDSSRRGDRCEKCGSGAEGDLRFVIFRGRTRYVGRTLCELCTEEVLETLLVTDPDDGPGAASA